MGRAIATRALHRHKPDRGADAPQWFAMQSATIGSSFQPVWAGIFGNLYLSMLPYYPAGGALGKHRFCVQLQTVAISRQNRGADSGDKAPATI